MKTRPIISALVLGALCSSPALAQTQDDLDSFGIVDDGKSLDEVVPKDPTPQSIAPETPQAAAPAGTADSPAPPVESAAAPKALPPADWTTFSLAGVQAAVPPDWVLVEESDDSKLYFHGDMAAHKGVIFGLSLDSSKHLMPPGAEIVSEAPVVIDGQHFTRLEFNGNLDARTRGEMITLYSADPWEDDEHLFIAAGAIGVPLAAHREQIETLFDHVSVTPVQPRMESGTVLGGLVDYAQPSGWTVSNYSSDQMITLRPELYSGYVAVALGKAVDGLQGLDRDIPPGTLSQKAIIFDQFADRFSWPVAGKEFLVGSTLVSGRADYYRLVQCVDSDPVAVFAAGAPAFFDSGQYQQALDALSFDQSLLGPCEAGGAVVDGAESAAGEETLAATPTAPADAAAERGSTPTFAVDVEGVTFLLPEGWTASVDSSTDKIFTSPDGRWTLLAFWWFPDEPLLGYDDITGVENVIVDHEPVTRIFHRIGQTISTQNVTERARGDKRRFIFTLEGPDGEKDQLDALHGWLVDNLHLQGGFNPGKRVDPVPSGPVPGFSHASLSPAPIRTGRPQRIDFAAGVQGWTGDHARLAANPSGGPDGGGVLEVFCAGDGINGYIVAPSTALGDWSEVGGLRVTVKTGSGTYVEPYDYGGRGDIYIESGAKSASIAFPTRVGSDWVAEEISFASPDWRLQGAASLAEILNDVTAFHVRAEFLSGDAWAWISSIDFLQGSAGTASQTPASGWQTYANARFGTMIEYPADVFLPQPPPDNGDGRTFVSADGSATFFVFGQHNYDDLDAAAMMERDRELGGYDQVTYRQTGKGWYVLSGYVGEDIFYRKVLIDRDSGLVHVFGISYPAAARETFNSIVTRMSKSFGPRADLGEEQPSVNATGPKVSDLPTVAGNPLDRAEGWWIIVGTFPTEPWQRQKTDLERMQSMAASCNLQLFNDFSGKFRGFRSGYNVFVVGAFESESIAIARLQEVRVCFPDAYVKYGEHLGE